MGPAAVHRLAEAVEHAAEQPRSDFHARVLAARHNPVAQLQAVGFFERHGEHAAVAEADHLRADASGPRRVRISQKSPIAAAGPCDSISKPTTSVTTPPASGGRIRCERAGNTVQDQYAQMESIAQQSRSPSPSVRRQYRRSRVQFPGVCVSTEASKLAARRFDDQQLPVEPGVARISIRRSTAALLQNPLQQRHVVGMRPYPVNLSLVDLRKRCFHQTEQSL